jgi:4'-phosphopantetheinyl transferase EntD
MNTTEFTDFVENIRSLISDVYGDSIYAHGCQILEIIDLTDNELIIIKRAVACRKYEFSAGRYCARKCLSHFGVYNCEILRHPHGEPEWPKGYTGSITHHGDIALSVVTHKSVSKSIGVDLISTDEVLGDARLILDASEILLIKEMHLDINPELLIFSIKEAAIKICSPLLQDFIDFRDLRLHRDSHGKLYVTHKLIDNNINIIWLVLNNFIFTLATLNN